MILKFRGWRRIKAPERSQSARNEAIISVSFRAVHPEDYKTETTTIITTSSLEQRPHGTSDPGSGTFSRHPECPNKEGGRPTASCRLTQVIFSAALLKAVMCQSRSTVKTPSLIESRITLSLLSIALFAGIPWISRFMHSACLSYRLLLHIATTNLG